MTQRAIKRRWETPKQLAEVVIRKHLTLAAGLPWKGPDGVERTVEYTPAQLHAATQTALAVEGQNQREEQHGERMEYYERALAARKGEPDVPGLTDLHLHLHATTVIETQHRRAAALEAIAAELSARDGIFGHGTDAAGSAGDTDPAGLASDPEVVVP